MASNANALAHGDEPVELSALIEQTVKNYRASQAKTGGEGGGADGGGSQTALHTGEPAPIRVNVDGQEREFANPTELARFYADRERQVRDAANSAVAAATAGAAVVKNSKEEPVKEEFKPDVKKFADMLVENPGAAVEFALAEHWGIAKPFELIKGMANKIAETEQVLAAREFRDKHEEYIANEHNGAAFQQIMQEFNLPMNQKGFELAYAVGKGRGAFELEEAETGTGTGGGRETASNYQSSQTHETRRPEGPPHARRNAQESQPIDWDAIEDLPTGEVEKIAERYARAVSAGRAR